MAKKSRNEKRHAEILRRRSEPAIRKKKKKRCEKCENFRVDKRDGKVIRICRKCGDRVVMAAQGEFGKPIKPGVDQNKYKRSKQRVNGD